MPQLSSEITRDALLAYASERGCPVTPAQLARWSAERVFPRPRRMALGHGKGTVSLYPQTAAPQAVALDMARRRHRSFDLMAWSIWLDGFPVTPRVREYLLDALDIHINKVRSARSDILDEDARRADIKTGRRRPMARTSTRARLASPPSDLLPLLQVVLGEYPGLSTAPLRRYGLVPEELAPREETIETALSLIARAYDYPRVRNAIARISDAALESGRHGALLLWRFFETELGTPLPLLPALPFTTFVSLTQLDPRVRLARSQFLRMIRDRGFTTFEEALATMRRSKT